MYKTDTVNEYNLDSIIGILKNAHAGGVIFCSDSLNSHLNFVNNLQKQNKVQLITGFNYTGTNPDFLNNFVHFPNFNTLNAVDNDTLRADFFEINAYFTSLLGYKFAYIPIKVSNNRDSGEVADRINDINCLSAVLNKNRILSGYKGLKFSENDSISYVLNKKIIDFGISAVEYDKRYISDTSRFNFTVNLTGELGFGGLIISDITDIKLQYRDSLLQLFDYGGEIFVTSDPLKTASTIKDLVQIDKISEESINQKVRKILLAKSWSNLKNYNRIYHDTVVAALADKQNEVLSRRLFKNSITLIKNKVNILPYTSLKNKRAYLYSIGDSELDEFSNTLTQYLNINKKYLKSDNTDIAKRLNSYGRNTDLIIALNNYTPDSAVLSKIQKLSKKTNLILVNFGSASNLGLADSFNTVIQVYGNSGIEQKYTADMIFGGIATNGKLPYTLNDSLKYSHSLKTEKIRLSYAIPEEVGADSEILQEIDSIVYNSIALGAMPGCQVFVAKGGKIILDKSYGHHTYSRQRRVRNNDLYDIASITKIAGTTLASMKMYEKGTLKLQDNLGKYFKNTHIEYSKIEPDTFINIDTLLISEIKDMKKLLKVQDTVHVNDSVLVAYDTLIVTATPKNNIFKVKIEELLVHKSGVSPVLPILPYILYKKDFYNEQQKAMDRSSILGFDPGSESSDSSSTSSSQFPKDSILTEIDTLKRSKNDTTLSDKTDLDATTPDTITVNTLDLKDSTSTKTNVIFKDSVFDVQAELKKAFEKYYTRFYIKDSAETEIAENFYLQNRYFDTLWNETKQLKVYSRKIYQYSDINMILLQQAIDTINDSDIGTFLSDKFYKPMGLRTICYKPLKQFSRSRIVPTENEKYWRTQLLRGHVHDPSAAILGGISGNAGLFSNAKDLGTIGQMWLAGGEYGGEKYLSKNTVSKFTGFQPDSHRGLGFDKPGRKTIIGEEAPSESYGHTGFTGACIWVDPVNDLVYVFLSNRVHPNQNNWKIVSLRIRQKIHSKVYESLGIVKTVN
jgi:CubicO group peptidase (beta-lactamase class C family)